MTTVLEVLRSTLRLADSGFKSIRITSGTFFPGAVFTTPKRIAALMFRHTQQPAGDLTDKEIVMDQHRSAFACKCPSCQIQNTGM